MMIVMIQKRSLRSLFVAFYYFFLFLSVFSVLWYTAMLGKKNSLKQILKILKSENIKNVHTTRFEPVSVIFSFIIIVSKAVLSEILPVKQKFQV